MNQKTGGDGQGTFFGEKARYSSKRRNELNRKHDVVQNHQPGPTWVAFRRWAGLFGWLLLTGAAALGQPIIQNGGFETGDFTGWTQTGNTNYTFVGSDPIYVHSGNYGAVFAPVGSLGFISQTVATVPGQKYSLSFWLNSPDGQTPNECQVSWNGS